MSDAEVVTGWLLVLLSVIEYLMYPVVYSIRGVFNVSDVR